MPQLILFVLPPKTQKLEKKNKEQTGQIPPNDLT
jgi:hypothetical protein